MKPGPSHPPKPVDLSSERQLLALLTLLMDEDPQVHLAIHDRFIAMGSTITPWLRRQAAAAQPAERCRIRDILNALARQTADTDFLTLCLREGEDLNLEHAAWLMAQTRYGDINPEGYGALVDVFAGDIQPLLPANHDPETILCAVNRILFERLKFKGNEENYYEEENSYLNRVIDRRTGNPISLSILYLLIARRLQLPIAGIGMPGHFLCRYQSTQGDWFIDAFNQGRVLSRAECVRYLNQTTHGYQESFLAPVTPRRIVMRVCSNLHQIYDRVGNAAEATRIQRYIVALAG